MFTTNILRWGSDIVVLWHWEIVSESFLDKLNILLVILHSTGDDEALLGSDVVHDELLDHSGIDVVDVLLHSESGHAESVEAVSGSQEHLLLVGEWVELREMLEEVVGLGILGSGNVGGEDGSRLKSDIDHHLEHINDVILDAVSSEEHSFLVVVHGHVTTRHLDHAVVDGLIGVLEGLQVGVLQSEKGTGGLSSFVSCSDIDEHTHMHGRGEGSAFGENSVSVGKIGDIVLGLSVSSLDWLVAL